MRPADAGLCAAMARLKEATLRFLEQKTCGRRASGLAQHDNPTLISDWRSYFALRPSSRRRRKGRARQWSLSPSAVYSLTDSEARSSLPACKAALRQGWLQFVYTCVGHIRTCSRLLGVTTADAHHVLDSGLPA